RLHGAAGVETECAAVYDQRIIRQHDRAEAGTRAAVQRTGLDLVPQDDPHAVTADDPQHERLDLLDAGLDERVVDAQRVHDALGVRERDRKSTRLNSSHVKISYAVFCLKKKK